MMNKIKFISRYFFFCICVAVLLSAVQASVATQALSDINRFHSDFINHNQDQSIGQFRHLQGALDSLLAEREGSGLRPFGGEIWPSSQPTKEEIRMDGSHSREHLGKIDAINNNKERDVVYEDVYVSDPQGSAQPRDIQIIGNRQVNPGIFEESAPLGDNIENKVNAAFAPTKIGSIDGASLGDPEHSINNLKIEVSGIDIKAINTAPSGNAIVKSNIIIKPVQIIIVPSDWKGNSEDLKKLVFQRMGNEL